MWLNQLAHHEILCCECKLKFWCNRSNGVACNVALICGELCTLLNPILFVYCGKTFLSMLITVGRGCT